MMFFFRNLGPAVSWTAAILSIFMAAWSFREAGESHEAMRDAVNTMVSLAAAEVTRDKQWENMDVLDNKDFRERLSAIETNVDRTNRLLEALVRAREVGEALGPANSLLPGRRAAQTSEHICL